MRKSLKLTAILAMSTSVLGLSQVNVGAYNTNQADLEFGWVQRSAGEVTESVNQALAVSDTYTVQWGDTLSSIAKAIGLSVDELTVLNSINNPDLIYAGTILTFDRENHQLTFTDEVTEEEVTISTETGEEVEPIVEDGTLIASVDEWVDSSVIEEPVLEDAVNEEIVEEAIVEEPAAAVASAQAMDFTNPLLESTETAEVIAEETVVEEEIVEEVIEEPVYEEPAEEIIEEPVLEPESSLVVDTGADSWETVETEPEYEEPVIEEPVYEEPVVEEPVYEEPVVETPQQGYSDPSSAFGAITAEKGLSQAEIDGWSMIISRESGWNPTIANPSSGAYGLPQALPGNKMASHGADWATNPYTQLAWMYDYMVGRYGSIQGAVDFWNANHWY